MNRFLAYTIASSFSLLLVSSLGFFCHRSSGVAEATSVVAGVFLWIFVVELRLAEKNICCFWFLPWFFFMHRSSGVPEATSVVAGDPPQKNVPSVISHVRVHTMRTLLFLRCLAFLKKNACDPQ